jgi:hypothetical protein
MQSHRLASLALVVLGAFASASCGRETTSSRGASDERRPFPSRACLLSVNSLRQVKDAEGGVTHELVRSDKTTDASTHARNRQRCDEWAREEPLVRWCMEPRASGRGPGGGCF